MKDYNKCPVAELCGGCDYQGVPYPKQCELKQDRINKLFKNKTTIKSFVKTENPFNYRNKIQVTFGKDQKGKIIVGNYAKDSHFLIPIDDCMICEKGTLEIIKSFKTLANKYHISIYDERIKRGCLRHLLIRVNSTNEYMVVIVTASPHINKEKELICDLLKYNKNIKSVIHNINNSYTSMILGKKSRTLYGKPYIVDELLDNKFRISASSFYQVNHSQAEKLYSTAIDFADFKGNETVIDAYCGTGTIGIILSKHVKEVIGVEINEDAIKDAIINKKNNKIDNIEFVCDDAGKYMTKLSRNKKHIDVVIMDPPRSGASKEFLNSLIKLKPNKVVYISCNPETLNRDLNYLNKNGYLSKKLQAFDMFPFTEHVECIALLSRK